MTETEDAKAERLLGWCEEFHAEYCEAIAASGAVYGEYVEAAELGMSGLAMNELAFEGYIHREGTRFAP